MGFRSLPKSVTLNGMTLNGVMAPLLRYFTKFGSYEGTLHQGG